MRLLDPESAEKWVSETLPNDTLFEHVIKIHFG